MDDYNECLIEAQLHRMGNTINDFLNRVQARLGLPGARPEDQRTLILIPGGMASELARATEPYTPWLGADKYTYETVWFNAAEILFGGALDLDMYGDRDKFDRLIVADGVMQNCLYKPYDSFIEWCQNHNLDVLTFAWDFRRRPAWIVDFFLEHFVPTVRQAAAGRGLPDPFARAVLVGHSFGGMLAKWILNNEAHPFCRDNLELAVSVGTPFYGYTSHTLRLFHGEPQIGSAYDLTNITKVISTMPGGYALFFLDGATFDEYADRLADDPVDPLREYPILDAADSSLRVDPYAVGRLEDGRSRYPQGWTWFESYLEQGLDAYRLIAKPLESVGHKFHNIRGVQVDGDRVPRAETPRSLRWGWVGSRYNPDEWPSPISELRAEDKGPGDGVIPAWSARLVTQDPANIHTVKSDLEHAEMLDDPGVRNRLFQLLALQQVPPPIPAPPLNPEPPRDPGRWRPKAASLEEYERHRNELMRIVTQYPRETARHEVQEYIKGLGTSETAALMRRHYIELAKPPVVLEPGRPRPPARSP